MFKYKHSLTLILVISGLALSACAGVSTAEPAASQNDPSPAEQVPDPVEEVEPLPEATPEPVMEDEPAPEPVEEAPPESDAFTAPITAAGDILIVTGRILDVNGMPLEGAAIEFWQTDFAGVYDHPGDPDTGSRDAGFQFYGTSTANADGNYSFRTILPGEYEPRPRHIHVKIRLNGTELLTTQFYFVEDGTTGGVGGGIDNLLLTLNPDTTNDGTAINRSSFDVVVSTGIGSGDLDLTDSQSEGPYYPVVDVSAYDNDLASIEN